MNDIMKAIILGIVEGCTEFLPISSTGHLILVNQVVSFDEAFTKMFDIVIQLGAIFSVVVYFWKRLFTFTKVNDSYLQSPTALLWKKTFVGVLPALAIGAKFGKQIQESLFNPTTVAITLLLGGVALIILERKEKKVTFPSVDSMSYSLAFLIGLIQCLAMVPGTSRSAATIIGAMTLGLSRVAAAEYSFFLAIPTLFAASAYSLLKTGLSMSQQEIMILAVGFLVSFFVAWAVVAGFMRFITKNNFKSFGYYRIVLGACILLYFYGI